MNERDVDALMASIFGETVEDLPVENVGDGEGTRIAGVYDKHLSLEEAMTCPVARAYLVAAFDKLSDEDGLHWMDGQDVDKLAWVSSWIMTDMGSYNLLAYVSVTEPEAVSRFIQSSSKVVYEKLPFNTPDEAAEYAKILQEKFNTK